jgi:hypothetical protein
MSYAFVSSTSSATTKTGFVIAAGQQVFVLATDQSAINSTLTLSDGTNTYVSLGTINDTRDTATYTLLACLNPTPGTYTLTLSGATSGLMFQSLYTGLASISVGSFQSFFSGAFPPTTTDGCATAAITPTSYPAAILAFGQVFGTLSAGTGFTLRSTQNSNPSFSLEDLELTSGSHIASYTMATGGTDVTILAVAVIESSSGAGAAPIAWIT